MTKPPLRGEREGGRRLKGAFLLSEMELLFFGKNTRCLNFSQIPAAILCRSANPAGHEKNQRKKQSERIANDDYLVLHCLLGQLQYPRSIVFWKV